MSTKHFQPGEVILREGEQSSDAYFLISGAVEITLDTSEGPRRLAVIQPGEIFGEMGMITDRPRSATATAIESTMTEVIRESAFEDRILTQPERLHTYLVLLFDRIRSTDALLQLEIQRSQGSIAERETTPILRAPQPAPPRRNVHLQSHYEGTGWHGQRVDMTLKELPFRIGRAASAQGGGFFARNDLNLIDPPPHHLSRSHCEIDRDGPNIVLRDRGSRGGCVVNGQPVGIDFGTLQVPLEVGENHVLLGSTHSPHRFVIQVTED